MSAEERPKGARPTPLWPAARPGPASPVPPTCQAPDESSEAVCDREQGHPDPQLHWGLLDHGRGFRVWGPLEDQERAS
jgi:hypothetical protein